MLCDTVDVPELASVTTPRRHAHQAVQVFCSIAVSVKMDCCICGDGATTALAVS
jgi:hypothetical protein